MSIDVVVQLRERIAALEVQLEHAKRQTEESAHGVRFLLNIQAQASISPDSIDIQDLRQEIRGLKLENQSLRDQIDLHDSSLDRRRSVHEVVNGQIRSSAPLRIHDETNALIDLAEPAIDNIPTIEISDNGKDLLQTSASFQSMMNGTAEWADGDAIPGTVDRIPVRPRTPLPVLSLQDIVHNPRRSLDRYTHRPAYARDENCIRWTPTSEKLQKSHRVVINGLPGSITYHQLLSQVCGGLVVSCQIVDTKNITGSMSALIRFYDNDESCVFAMFAKKYPLLFFDSAGVQVPVTVELADLPSFPLTARRLGAIRNFGHTRCIEIHNFPLAVDTPEAVNDLRYFLRPFAACDVDFIEHIEVKTANSIFIAFTSIDAATNAFGLLMGNPTYRNCTARFVSDPCNRPAKLLVEMNDEVNHDEIDVSMDEGSEDETQYAMLTTPDLTDREDCTVNKMERGVPSRWDSARERQLELAALRRSPGSRD